MNGNATRNGGILLEVLVAALLILSLWQIAVRLVNAAADMYHSSVTDAGDDAILFLVADIKSLVPILKSAEKSSDSVLVLKLPTCSVALSYDSDAHLLAKIPLCPAGAPEDERKAAGARMVARVKQVSFTQVGDASAKLRIITPSGMELHCYLSPPP